MLTLSTLGPHVLGEPLVPRARAAPSIPEPSRGKGVVGSLPVQGTGEVLTGGHSSRGHQEGSHLCGWGGNTLSPRVSPAEG